MDNEIAQLLVNIQQGVTSIDQANHLLVQCYNVITDLQSKVPKPKTDKQKRSDQQRNAMELYFKMMAEALNEAGHEFTVDEYAEMIKNKGRKIPWTQERFKDFVWRGMQKPLLGKVSTTSLEPKEVSQVYEVVNMKMAEWAGVSMQFPNRRG